MPWDERTHMDQRVRFIGALESCGFSMTQLCAAFGISRKTGYKWAARFVAEGAGGLADRSRAPRHSPHRTDEACEAVLVRERLRRPGWGARKLLHRLRRRHPSLAWPADSTGAAILKRHGLVTERRRRRMPGADFQPVAEARSANQLWTADFKGEFRTGDRQLCYPLTVADRFSRYVLDCRGRGAPSFEQTWPVFQRVFGEYGLPEAILTDGGAPFSSPRSPRRLSRLSVEWIKLGIRPVLIEPGKPQQNGSHERMHRELKRETARPPAATRHAQQRVFDRFRLEYNEERPHEGIGMRTPAELYEPSARSLPSRVEEMSYPGHYEVRKVRSKGEIKWCGDMLFVSEVLSGESVGLEETTDGFWSLYFGPVLLGRYDQRDRYLALL